MKFSKTILALSVALASGSVLAEVQELQKTVIKAKEKNGVSSEDLKKKLITNLDDLTRGEPGIEMRAADSRWGNSGFNIRGVADDRVAVSIDGLAQGETLQYEGGQAYGYFKGGMNGFDLATMKAVKITKGADSVISGSGALGGSVRFVTKDADDFLEESGDDWGGQVSAMYSSASKSSAVTLAGAARSGRFESLVIATKSRGHETKNHTSGLNVEGSSRGIPDPQDKDKTNLLVKLNYDLSDDNTFGVILENYKRNTETDSKSYNGNWYVGRFGDDTSERKRVGLFHKLKASEGFFDQLEWALDRQTINFEAKTKQSVTFYGGLTPRVDTRSFDQKLTQFKLDLQKQLNEGAISHDVFYGLALSKKDVVNDQRRVQTRSGKPPKLSVRTPLIPEAETRNINLYFLDKINFSEDTQVDIGLRYDKFKYSATPSAAYPDRLGGNSLADQSFSFISGSLGVKQSLNDHLEIGAKLGRGFRAPTIEQLYTRSGTEDNWRSGPNPNLDVETATNFEVTIRGEFEEGMFSVTPFYSKYDNFIQGVKTSRINNLGVVDEYYVPENIGESNVKGIEFSSLVDLNKTLGAPEGLSLSVRSAYTKGTKKNGDPLTSVQPWNGRISLGYDTPDDTWGMNTSFAYTAAKKAEDAYSRNGNGNRVERDYLSNSSTVINVTGYYNITQNLTIRGGVFNLTDDEYYTWDGIRFIGRDDIRPGIGVNSSGINRYSEPGRNFKLRVDYKF